MKIKKFNESVDENDPYGEENWGNELVGIEYLESLNDKKINKQLNKLFSTDNLNKRISAIDNILSIIEDNYPNDYDRVQDSILDLAI